MRKLFLLTSIVIAFLPAAGKNAITLKRVDALYKICPSDSLTPECNDTLRLARGESATMQLLLESDGDFDEPSVQVKWRGKTPETDIDVKWVCDVAEYIYADDSLRLQDPTSRYPDPVRCRMNKGKRATAWIDINVPRNAKPGLYKGKVIVTTQNREKICSNFALKIYNVTLPENQSLTVTNWHYREGLGMMNNGEDVQRGSERFFELLEIIATEAVKYKQNCWCITNRPKVEFTQDGTDLSIDFGNFDREVELLMKHGNLQRMTSGHFGWKEGDDLLFDIPYWDPEKGSQICETDVQDPRTDRYVNLYFPKLQAHLEEKGWLDIYAQHICDEPGDKGAKSWGIMAGKIKNAAPGLRTAEACDQDIDNMDIQVLLLGHSIAEKAKAEQGKERWMYVCVVPQQNFANRFVQQPLLKTRLLHWINYRYHATGFLHWGLNWWDNYRRLPVPDGDSFLLYPEFNRVDASIRAYAQRDGVNDYELLKMIEARNPEKAMDFARELILAPDQYDLSIPHFRSVRRHMLEYLDASE